MVLEELGIPTLTAAEWFKIVLLIVIGVIVGGGVKFFIKRIAKVTLYPWVRKSSPSSYKSTVSGVELTASIVQWMIIILFIFQALSIFQIFLLQEILLLSVDFLPKFIVAFFILIIGLLITGIISRKIRNMDFKRSEIISKVFSIIFMTATILSALEVVGIQVTAFLYLFIALLLTAGLAIAIAVGVSFGLALRPEITKLINDIKKSSKK